MTDALRKYQLQKSYFDEKRLISSGELQEDNPKDHSPAFSNLCEAARRGDLKVCQEAIQQGANINASDAFDYTPLILASLCGHYEVVQLLLESGALCERDTFQGERCLHNALNDRIRDLLLAYDYSKATDPLQPYAAHINLLFVRDHPKTSDFLIQTGTKTFAMHRFILAARSPYFKRKLAENPELESWALPDKIPTPSIEIVLRYFYLGEIPRDVKAGHGDEHSDEEILSGIDRLAKLFETQNLIQRILEADDRRVQRQQRTAEVARGRSHLETWFKDNVLPNAVEIETNKADQVKWSKNNTIFADVLLRADDEAADELTPPDSGLATPAEFHTGQSSIPIGPMATAVSDSRAPATENSKSKLFPAHKAMLLRAEYFVSMFSSGFLEAQDSEYLRIIPVACSPAVLETILIFLYADSADFGLQLAVDVLFAADMLLIERLKAKTALVISSLGNGVMTANHPAARSSTDPFLPAAAEVPADDEEHAQSEEDPLDPFATLRAAWDLRVPRLETFAARYFAYRLERYIDTEDFLEIVRDSAARIKGRQETDTIELIDDIRYYLSERFRLRFEGDGLDMFDEDSEQKGRQAGARIEGMEATGADPTQRGTLHDTRSMEKLTLDDTSKPSHETDFKEQPASHVGDDDLYAERQVIRTLDGDVAGDEFSAETLNYQILMGKLDKLLDVLQLDA